MTDYRTVTVRIGRVTPKAIEVLVPNRQGSDWIPRSLVHGGDDLKISQAIIGTDWTFRVLEWKAEELGLAG